MIIVYINPLSYYNVVHATVDTRSSYPRQSLTKPLSTIYVRSPVTQSLHSADDILAKGSERGKCV